MIESIELIEHWIEFYDNPRYVISSFGNVYDRFLNRLLVQTPCRLGYLRVKVYINGERITASVARLVAGAFYAADINDYEVNHKDGNKQNNHITNLELCDRSEQMLHAFEMGLAKPVYAPRRVRIIETQEVFDSTGQADRHLGVSSGSVSKTLRGLQQTCKGHTFEFVD